MKEFFEIMEKDFLKEDFTAKEWLVYGVVAPIGLLLMCGLAEWFNNL